jgi:hypothetical protein
MSTNPTLNHLTMNNLTNIVFIPNSLYEPSNIIFVNDTNAYITVNIDLSAVTNITSWCKYNTKGPFIVNKVS